MGKPICLALLGEAIGLMEAGMKISDVAQRLGVSDRTVKRWKKNEKGEQFCGTRKINWKTKDSGLSGKNCSCKITYKEETKHQETCKKAYCKGDEMF